MDDKIINFKRVRYNVTITLIPILPKIAPRVQINYPHEPLKELLVKDLTILFVVKFS